MRQYETMLNSCLVERIISEQKYSALSQLLQRLWGKSDEYFAAKFDKQQIQHQIAMAESTEEQTTPGEDTTFNLE